MASGWLAYNLREWEASGARGALHVLELHKQRAEVVAVALRVDGKVLRPDMTRPLQDAALGRPRVPVAAHVGEDDVGEGGAQQLSHAEVKPVNLRGIFSWDLN